MSTSKKSQPAQSQPSQVQEPVSLQAISEAYSTLDAAVKTAKSAIHESMLTYNRLMNPRHSKKLSQKEITRSNNERKWNYIEAVEREKAAFQPLCTAMDCMHKLIGLAAHEIKSTVGKRNQYEYRRLLRIKFIQCCRLYERALNVLSCFTDMPYELTLDAYLSEEYQAAAAWFEEVPELPEHPDCDSGHHARDQAVVFARCLRVMQRLLHRQDYPEDAGFLGEARDTDHLQFGAGSGVLVLDGVNQQVVAGSVCDCLQRKGWDIRTNPEHSGQLLYRVPGSMAENKPRD